MYLPDFKPNRIPFCPLSLSHIGSVARELRHPHWPNLSQMFCTLKEPKLSEIDGMKVDYGVVPQRDVGVWLSEKSEWIPGSKTLLPDPEECECPDSHTHPTQDLHP